MLTRQAWFSVTEDCDQDRLRVWKWNRFAHSAMAHHVCGRRHLRELILHWMTTVCLHYPFATDPRITISNSVCGSGAGPQVTPQQLAEITVDRGSIQRVLAETPFSLNVIFEELMIALEQESPDEEFYRFDDAEFAMGGF